MYRIEKVLNNNSILASKDNQEVIFLGKGIGFGKKINDIYIPSDGVKKYKMETKEQEKRLPHEIIRNVDPVFIEIASDIIRFAQEQFDHVDTKILLPLADHIDFAIKRIQENVNMSNPFTKDIELLFPEEYKVALKGKQLINSITGFEITEDEVGYITLHVHSAISTDHVGESMQAMEIIHESIDKLRKELNIGIDRNSISYIRLMNHIKYLLLRLNTEEKLQMDISDFTQERFPFAYERSKGICIRLSKVMKKEIPQSEIGYLALHLERILSIELK